MCNKKTKIYRTIKGLIILFIKLQFFIRCNQAFRPLRTSTSNIYFNLSLNPNGLVTCIIPNTFISSPIYIMCPDGYITEVSMHLIKFRSRTIYSSSLGATSLPTRRPLSFLLLLWHFCRRSWHAHKREVIAASSWTYIHTATKECSRVIQLTLRQVGNLQKDQIYESYVPQ